MPPKSTSHPPKSGVSTEFLELEGTTSFAPSPSPTYRYSMVLKNDKLRIWLEDCESKKQWCTSDLDLDNYVHQANTIADAAATEYVEFFRALLDKPAEDAGVLPRTFRPIKDDVFRMELSMKFQVLMLSRVVKYTFDLVPMTVEKIDVAESRLRDLQEQLKTQQTEGEPVSAELHQQGMEMLDQLIKTLDSARRTVIQAQATTSVNQVIIWGAVNHHINGTDGIIRNLKEGLYEITASLYYVAQDYSRVVQLMKGTECIHTASCFYHGRHPGRRSTMTTIARIEVGEQLSFRTTADISGQTCHLMLVRLGN